MQLDQILDDDDIDKPGKAPAGAPSWRDVIKVHPAADLFPMMTAAELKTLAEDIRKYGMAVPVVFWADKDGREFLLDGRNRLDAMELVRLPVVDTEGRLHVPMRCRAALDPYEFVLSVNAHRRHLTPEQKREITAKVIKAQPEKSNRTIAKQVKVDHKTVGTVRAKLEAGGEIPHHDLREDARGTKQPSHKPSKPQPVPAAAEASATSATMPTDDIGPSETRSLILQLAAAKYQIDELKTKHRFKDITGQPFLATIVELDFPVVWTPEEIIADIEHPNLTPEHLRRAAELLHDIADALEVRKAKPSPPVAAEADAGDDGIPHFLRRRAP